ncbi:anion permease [Halomicroarcula sp. F13]|uniref:Anion permease n=1 Tax=Haloarcula rubra TaxID=2487747 RepID=A0AAW4PZ29_9EURY|nr:SLC13 family permease [Halomicroarcula rubra]MBX0325447.1 anion permease [Halomicroarcula rubra]
MSDETASRAAVLRGVDPAWLSVPVGMLAAGAVLRFAPLSAGAARMLGITLFCIALWVGAPVKPWFTALLGVGLIGVAFSTDLALTGFQSPATWLVVVGILIGEAARQSGLADLVERLALHRMPAAVATDAVAAYRYLLVVLSFGSLALAVLVPSSLVRVLILAPILQSLGDLFDERRAKVGIFLGPLFATFYGSSGILTGSLANIIVTGLVESSGGPAITWTEWTLWLGPVMGLGRVALIVGIAYVLYRPSDRDGVNAPDWDGTVSTTSRERRMLVFLLLGVAIWATDFLHGLHPLFGAVVVTLLAFAPRIGVVGAEAVGEADFSILFFLGAIFAIAEGLRQTAFTDLAANRLLSTLPADPSLPLVLGVVVVAALALTLVMEGLAVASVLTPILVSFATSAGIPLVPVAMIEAVALNAYFFPYQSAVLVAILGLDVVDSMELTKMASVCSLATLLLLVPVQIAIFTLSF